MFKKLKIAFQYGSTFCGIEHTSMHGELQLYAVVLKHSKNELVIAETLEENNVDGLSKKLKTNQHASLVINHKAVLFKPIESDQSDALKLVNEAFPNIAIEEFYFEILLQSNSHFVAICRKEVVDKIIEDYKTYNINIINISLGHTILGSVKNYINTTPFYTSNSKVTVANNYIETINIFDVQHETYDLNGLSVSSTHLLASAGAIKSLVNQGLTQHNVSQANQDLLNSYNHKRFHSLFLKMAGPFVFGVLLINFFVFNHYFNKVNALNDITQFNQAAKTQIVSLKEDVSSKQKMITDLLQSTSSKSSFYTNSIVHSLPESILLNELNYQPLKKRLKAEKLIELIQNNLTISGYSNNSKVFSQWIFTLENQPWIALVEITDYGNTSNERAEFELKIVLKNDR